MNVTAVASGESLHLFTAENDITVGQLQPFTTYSCTVAAQTEAGIGPYSALPVPVTTAEARKLSMLEARISIDSIVI